MITAVLYGSKVVFQYEKKKPTILPYLTDSDNSIVVELAGNEEKNGIYYLSRSATVDDLLVIAGMDYRGNGRDKYGRITLKNGDKVFVYKEKDGKDDITIGTMDPSTQYVLDMPMNVNTATIDDLELIPGVGKKTAQIIVDFREKTGAFRTLDELREIETFRGKRFDQVKRYFYIQH